MVQKTQPDDQLEQAALAKFGGCVAGVDEAGRGPLAGPVVAAAVILPDIHHVEGLNDSKQLTAKNRAILFENLEQNAITSTGSASPEEIDALNIHHASLLAMRRALDALRTQPRAALIDGRFVPPQLAMPAQPVVKGDRRSLSIAAASIIAKVTRDRLMISLDMAYPGYGWARNMGYPTAEHLAALNTLGVTPHHRRSFRPVHNILMQQK